MPPGDKNPGGNIPKSGEVVLIEQQSAIAFLQPFALARPGERSSNRKLLYCGLVSCNSGSRSA